jgi:hypothetical protein
MNNSSSTTISRDLPFSVLLGRETEMRLLKEAFHAVEQSKQVQIVTTLGESGWGKTRLLTELYEQLSQEYGQGYWPERLYNDPETMRLNPQAQDFLWTEQGTSQPGFYWWGMRSSKPDQRNTNTLASQLQLASQSLLPHLLFADHAKLVSESRKSALDLCLDALIEITPTIIGASLLPGTGLIKPIFAKYKERSKRRQDIEKIQKAMSDASSAEFAEIQSTADQLLLGIDALIHRASSAKTGASKKIPFVICLDDAHWLDTFTAGFISALIAEAQTNQWPVLLLITAWPSEWHQLRSAAIDTQFQSLFQKLDHHPTNTLISLEPCSKVDQLIETELPGLPLEQRTLIAVKAGPDLYGLNGLIADLKTHPKRFLKRDVHGRLTESGIKYLETLGPVRVNVARGRLFKLTKQQQEILSILSLLGSSFIHRLGQELLERLQLDGWNELSNINISQELLQIKDLHHYFRQPSLNTFEFVDEVKNVVAKELILDDPTEVTNIKFSLLSVVNNWLEKAVFEELSPLELPVFFDNVQWALISVDKESSKHNSLKSMIHWRLDVLQDIFAGPNTFRKNTFKFSGTQTLDISAFRAGLPLWWQATWILNQSQITHHAALQTYEGLIKGSQEILEEAIAELRLNSDWKLAQAAANAATAIVSLTCSCINQSLMNGYEINERELLLNTQKVLQNCLSKLKQIDAVTQCVAIVLLIEISEVSRDIEKKQQALFFNQAITELTQLIRSNCWGNAEAEFLFERDFFDVLYPDLFNLEASTNIKPLADALVAMTEVSTTKKLGSFQLATLAMAYYSLYFIDKGANQNHLLAESIECCLELIQRKLGGIVASHCWLGGFKVKRSAMLGSQHSPDEVTLEYRQILAWEEVNSILLRVFAEESQIPPKALFEICKTTLTPYAALFFEPWQVEPGELAAFIKQVISISPNSSDMLLTSACYAWYLTALNQAGNQPAPNDSNWLIHQFEAIKAIRLIPPKMVLLTKDYQREMKLEIPFFEAIDEANLSIPRVSKIHSMVVAAIDCKDFYTPQDFAKVIWNLLLMLAIQKPAEISPNFIDLKEMQIQEFARILLNSINTDKDAISSQLMDQLMIFKQKFLHQ